MAEALSRLDLGEVLTDLARDANDKARDKGLILLYDYEGPLILVETPQGALRALLGHGLEHIIRRSDSGYLFFGAQAHEDTSGQCRLLCRMASNAATSGAAAHPAEIAEFPDTHWDAFWQIAHQSDIRGHSDLLDARVSVHTIQDEGEVVHMEMVMPCASTSLPHDSADAHGARAWLIANPLFAAAPLAHRLQRLGWRTNEFASLAEMRAALEHNIAPSMPRLVIGMAAYLVSGAHLAELVNDFPETTLLVLAAPQIRQAENRAASERVQFVRQPVSPAQLLDLTRRLAQPDQTRSASTAPGALGHADRRRVLVVDDNAVNQILVTEMLQLLGFDATIAEDGVQAIELCKQASPHAVLMDVHMPRLNGLQATRELRRLQDRGAIDRFPIIGTTADYQARQACIAAGMDEFLTKPIHVEELERLLAPLSLGAAADHAHHG